MRGDDEGRSVLARLIDEEIEGGAFVGGVEVSGRFIGEDKLRCDGECAANCDALALALGELAGAAWEVVGDACEGGHFLTSGADSLIAQAEVEGQEDVVADGEVLDELELLEDESDVVKTETDAGLGGLSGE